MPDPVKKPGNLTVRKPKGGDIPGYDIAASNSEFHN